MQRTLDSSPVLLQPAKPPKPMPVAPRKSLKRTASLASLPTPPRSTNDKKRVRRDEPTHEDTLESSDDENDDKLTNLPVARVLFQPKRKKIIESKLTKEAERDLFWLGSDDEAGSDAEHDGKPGPAKEVEEPKARSTIGSAPASPPPSRTNQVGPRFQTPPPTAQRTAVVLATPDLPSDAKEDDDEGPIRDTPNNLFLVDSKKAHPILPEPESPSAYEEPETIAYVFRGRRKEFPNPLHNLPPEALERSKLPTAHPEYSPSPVVRPRRLFTKDVKNRRQRSPTPPSPSEMLTRQKRSKAKPSKRI